MKLSTKFSLIFILATAVVSIIIIAFFIPYVKEYLTQRELAYAHSFLQREAQILHTRLRFLNNTLKDSGFSETEKKEHETNILNELNQSFSQFYFHESGRLFVIDYKGNIRASSDSIKNGRTVNNLWVYKDGSRDKLIQDILRSPAMQRTFDLEELNDEHKIVKKTLFVAKIPQSDFNFAGLCDTDRYTWANSDDIHPATGNPTKRAKFGFPANIKPDRDTTRSPNRYRRTDY